MRRRLMLVVFAVFAACSNRASSPPITTSTLPITTTTTDPRAVLGVPTPTTARAVTAAGCPVPPDQLRSLTIPYWGFDDASHIGTLVVHVSVADAVTKVFATLYRERFPIRKMVPIDAYGGSDEASLQDDNTAGFNCRRAVASGPPRWSVHAYGKAIDVNPVENPYIEGGKVHPTNGAEYVQRSPYRPGMAVPGGTLVNAFASVGWQWGGRWSGTPDYQHFSSTGG